MKTIVVLLFGVVILAWLAIEQRHFLLYQSAKITGGSTPALIAPVEELASTIRFDDYYTIDKIAPDT